MLLYSGTSISHVFSSSGPDTFEVQVSDQGGYTATRNFTIDVGLYVTIAANQTSGLGRLSVQFSSSVLGGTGYSYNWTFSPGHYSLLQDPTYQFPVGNYTVHFSVTSDRQILRPGFPIAVRKCGNNSVQFIVNREFV